MLFFVYLYRIFEYIFVVSWLFFIQLLLYCFVTKKSDMKTILWLDDLRNPFDERNLSNFNKSKYNIEWVRSYEEFIDYIYHNGIPDIISFDHDLGEEKSGADCANYLCEYCIETNTKIPDWYVHSANPAGVENIISKLRSAEKVINTNKKMHKDSLDVF